MGSRKQSVKEVNLDTKLNLSSYEEILKQLDLYYGVVKRQLLMNQNAVTGLFPVLSNESVVGSVRESVYCAAAIWALHQAYRRIDDDRGRSYELGQSAVKCMRGILLCWTRQSDRLEKFKANQSSEFSLHAKFHMDTGDAILSDSEYCHLQIGVVSLYLLFLVQMISSGLQIIYTQAEVAMIQNLVYYVERAYRTPDFGMWERGTKYNDGTPEIHASSIGLAKSALEAINGCNLFGEKGASWSVIYVDIDAHNRNRSIFESLLPRESSSKSIDASLLPTLSFPAFATHDTSLCNLAKSRVVKALCGRNGFKRFARDGYKCPIEDPNRRYYHEGETKEFEGIECEWPKFFLYMIIDGVFKSDQNQVDKYQSLVFKILQKDSSGDPVLPMYFSVNQDSINDSKRDPDKCSRIASEEGSASGPLYLMNQALLIISNLLTSGLLHVNEIDPIRRYLPSFSRPKKTGRYSAFQAKPIVQTGTAADLVVQIVLIAESMRLQAMMATYGIQTQTPQEVEPVQIWSSNQLVQVYKYLGVNKKLATSGRPTRPIGALGTSKIYRVCGMTVLCYPLIFEVSEFYLYRDMALLIDDIKTELQFVSRYWRLSGRPTICLLIREEHMRDPQFNEMLDLMAMLKKGYCEGVKVRIGRLQNLIASSCIEHLDFMSTVDSDIEFQPFKQLVHDYIGYQSLTDVPKADAFSEELENLMMYEEKSVPDILEVLRYGPSMYARAQLYGILIKKVGIKYEIKGKTIEKHLSNLYFEAGSLQYWRVVRYCSSLLGHTVDSISPFITAVLVNSKQITVGVVGHEETVIDKPMTPQQIREVMYSTVRPHDIVQAVLQQEIVLYCGRLIATNPDIFTGILKIRIGWVIEAMKQYLEMKGVDASTLDNLSPFKIRLLLHKIFTVKEWAHFYNITPLERRRLEGCLCRVPVELYDRVWDILGHTPGLRVQGKVLPSQPTLTNMSRSELSFALLLEQMLHNIQQAEYRQIIVELLCIVWTILVRNPELTFTNELDLDDLVSEALKMFAKDHGHQNDMNIFYSAMSSITTGYLARAVVNNLLRGGHFTATHSMLHGSSHHDFCTIS